MIETVVALFGDRALADAAARKLESLGYPRDGISVVTRERMDVESEVEQDSLAEDEEDPIGAGKGAVVGGTTGFLVGLGAMIFPLAGPFAGLGLGSAAICGGLGALLGSVFAPVLDMFMGAGAARDEDRARDPDMSGESIVSLDVDESHAQQVREVFLRAGAVNVDESRFGDEPSKALDGRGSAGSTMYGYSMDTGEYDPASEDRSPGATFIGAPHTGHTRER